MLDIKYIRENPDFVQKNAMLKKVDVNIQELLEFDDQRKSLRQTVDELNQKRNEAARSKDIEQGKMLKLEVAEVEQRLREAEEAVNRILSTIPNMPSDDTPVGDDESANVVIKTVGEPTKFSFEPKPHWDLGVALDIIDNERAAKVSGARFTYLKGDAALLQFALIQFTMSVLINEGVLSEIAKEAGLNVDTKPFVPVIPPVLINPEPFARMARLEPREERYHISTDDVYLIGSAEHTLGAMHMDEVLTADQLPLRYVGYSTSFRREAGSYGKDTKGILRVHQFDKLEIESFSLKENGLSEQQFIVAIQEYLLGALKLPYQVVSVSTGDMGGPDHKQVDIETWMPGQNKYRETHSSDYNTDYQSRRLNTRVKRADGTMELVHMNDATVFAIGRTLIAILENYQQEDGSVKIPSVLQPYMFGITEIKAKNK